MAGHERNDNLRESHRAWAEDALKGKYNARESKWAQSVAARLRDFTEKTKEKLGIKIRGGKITESNGVFELKESNAMLMAMILPIKLTL